MLFCAQVTTLKQSTSASGNRDQTTQDSNSWEVGSRKGEPYNCPSLLPWEFLGHRVSWEPRWNLAGSSPSWRNSWESQEVKAAPPSYRAENWCGESCTKGEFPNLQRVPLEYLQQSVCMWGNHSRLKNHPEVFERPVLKAHKGPGILPVPTSQTGKPHNSQSMEYSERSCLISGT